MDTTAKYAYCVNTFRDGEPIQLTGYINAESEVNAINRLILEGVVYHRGYEFLELRKATDQELIAGTCEMASYCVHSIDGVHCCATEEEEELCPYLRTLEDVSLDAIEGVSSKATPSFGPAHSPNSQQMKPSREGEDPQKSKEGSTLQWNVFVHSKRNELVEYNIFKHRSFYYDVKETCREHKEKVTFAEQLRRDLMYYFWSKCEWEFLIETWPPDQDKRTTKVDVFQQVDLNWEHFVDYVWTHRNELQ